MLTEVQKYHLQEIVKEAEGKREKLNIEREAFEFGHPALTDMVSNICDLSSFINYAEKLLEDPKLNRNGIRVSDEKACAQCIHLEVSDDGLGYIPHCPSQVCIFEPFSSFCSKFEKAPGVEPAATTDE